MTDIARQYALAVFALAHDEQATLAIDACFHDYGELSRAEHLKVFNNPRLTKQERKAMLESLVKNELFRHFLYVLIDNDRFELLRSIGLLYAELVRDMNKIMRVQVISQAPLDNGTKTRLIQKLQSAYHRQIELEEAFDPAIIAGFRLVYDGSVIDETVNRRLEELRTSLKR